MRIRFTPSARAQFLHAVATVQQDDPAAAVRFRARAEAGLRRLARFPRSGRLIPEFPELPHRELIVRPYRFFYRVEMDTIWVVGVWHGARSVTRPAE